MNNRITKKTLNDLEFYTVLERIKEYCISNLGKKAVLEIRPLARSLEIKEELYRLNEYLSSMVSENKIPNHYFDEITKEIHILGIENSFLEGNSFQKISSISTNVNNLITFLNKFKEYYPTLFHQSEGIEFTQVLIKEIEKIISPFGEIIDNASNNLKIIRKEINSVRGKISTSFTKSLSYYAGLGYLDEIRESVVDNQRVLAVQAMYRKKVRGSLLGSSKTGSIVFIAPEATLQFSRELRNLEYDEKEEIIRILKELTSKIRPYSKLLEDYQNYLCHLDVLAAKAKYAYKINACLPHILREKKIFLRDAYHPILLEENKEKQIETVPQTLELNERQQIIVISGPNAGGKSITLKTIGLLQLMIQSGILIPVHEKSEISIFDNILTDIGDNQSIENQLSTYSYRLKNMRNFFRKCNNNTLFLIDEFGTGSDPELGGALAEVFLEEFYDKSAFGIITTHYANLKVLASELENVVNGNMQFDEKSLEPSFKLHIGQAGSSFTFEVAQKNGIPFRLINRAKKKVESEKLRLDKTISKLQKERNRLQQTTDKLEKEKIDSKENSEKLISEKLKVQEKLNSFQELYDQNQKMLTYGRKSNELLNKFFQTKNKKELMAEFTKWVTIEQAKKEKLKDDKISKIGTRESKETGRPLSKRQTKEINKKVKEEEKKKLQKLREVEKEILSRVNKISERERKIVRQKAREKLDYQFQINDKVRMIDGTAKGTIEKIEKNIATINYGLFIAKSDVKKLELVKAFLKKHK